MESLTVALRFLASFEMTFAKIKMTDTPSILAIIALLFGGVVLAFPVLIPPIKNLVHQSAVARMILFIILGLLSYLIVFIPLARLSAGTMYVRALVSLQKNNPSGFLANMNELMGSGKDPIIDELWVRQMTPPSMRPQCYSSQSTVCARTNSLVTAVGPSDWDDAAFLRLAGTGLVSVAINVFLVWIFTTKPRKK
jgi:hypothetical protein